jgi:NAD+ synthase (glutamine-hydrolysing)
MNVVLAQINPTIGDVEGNLALMKEVLENLVGRPELVVFPELSLTGYPPRDLLTFEWFLSRIEHGVEQMLEASKSHPGIAILFGTPRPTGSSVGKGLANAALVIRDGEVLLEQHKRLLPTYDVFDEHRYFDRGSDSCWKLLKLNDEKLGVSICEDAWNDEQFEERTIYDHNPIQLLAEQGATLLINIAASPYHLGKNRLRYERNAHHARRWGVPYLTCAQVGGNDELIFDGRSLAVDSEGVIIDMLAPFESDVRLIDTSKPGTIKDYPAIGHMESLRQALALGIRDYMRKVGFRKVVFGLSGGIDSALVAAIAVDAVGPENVTAVTMPSQYSSSGSVDDSVRLAENLGIRIDTVPIRSVFDAFIEVLAEPFENVEPDVTEENLQARIRGTLLMAYSNKFGSLLLSTGNKSELAMGYCTLYGDMDGGLAVISDLTKSQVYELAKWYNRDREVIPEAILTKPPSAELRPDQKDQDSLPPYEVLDPILVGYLEEGFSVEELTKRGNDPEMVRWVISMVERSEYKRWQAAPGLRVSPKAFGAGRRMPIAARKSQ